MNDKAAQDRWQALKDWASKTWETQKEPIVSGLVGAGLGGGLGTYLGATGPQDPEEKHPVLGPALTGALLGGVGGAGIPYGWNAFTGGPSKREGRGFAGVLPALQKKLKDISSSAVGGTLTSGPLVGAGALSALTSLAGKGRPKGEPGGMKFGPRYNFAKMVEHLKDWWDAHKEIAKGEKGVRSVTAPPGPSWMNPSSEARKLRIQARAKQIADKLREQRVAELEHTKKVFGPQLRAGRRGALLRGLGGLVVPAAGAATGSWLEDIVQGQGD